MKTKKLEERYTILANRAKRIIEAIDRALEKRGHMTAIRKIIGSIDSYESITKEMWSKLESYLTEKQFLSKV